VLPVPAVSAPRRLSTARARVALHQIGEIIETWNRESLDDHAEAFDHSMSINKGRG
jgi:hypothetical protein